jgi:hypothetical protein
VSKPMERTQVAVRLPKEVLTRAARLVDPMKRHPEYSAWRVSRNGVLRLAIMRGLEVLEKELGANRGER